MTNIPIIAFAGFKGSGKDVAANYASKHFKNPIFINFTDPVRTLITDIFEVSMPELTDSVKKEQPLKQYPYQSPRFIMQRLATECFRKYWPDIWIRYWEREVKQRTAGKLYKPDAIFVTDVRFANEVKIIKDLGGIIIKIDRKKVYPWQIKYPKFIRLFLPRIHESESLAEYVMADHIVINNNNLRSFKKQIDTLVQQINFYGDENEKKD